MANSADPDQLASEEANWSGSTLFAKAGHIRVQQVLGKKGTQINIFLKLQENICCGHWLKDIRKLSTLFGSKKKIT